MNDNKRYDHSEVLQRVELAHQRAAGLPLGDVKLTLLVKYNARLLGELMDKTVEPYGISSVAYIALMTLQSTPENLANPSELCSVTGETRSNMTRVADELVAKGLIKRVTNEEDRRRLDLSLTEAGMDLLRTIVPVLRSRTEAVFSVFSAESKIAIEGELLQLKQALEAYL